jgi:PEP-CTERM motif
MRRERVLTILGLLLVLASAASNVQAGGIVPPGGTYGGLSYNDLEVKWWQNVFSIPVVSGNHPLITGGAFPGANGVLFLSGIGGGATFDVTISNSTALFFPILNVESSVFEAPPFHGDDEASLRANSNALIDNSSGFFASIDGTPVDLTSFRFQSPLFQWGPLPNNNLFQFFGVDAPAGTTSDSVDAGYYLLLTPLSTGQHVIHFGGTFDPAVGGSIDSTYTVNVVPEPSGLGLLGIGTVAILACVRRFRVKR